MLTLGHEYNSANERVYQFAVDSWQNLTKCEAVTI